MVDASDIVPGLPQLGEADEQDMEGDLTKAERQVLPTLSQDPALSRGEMEKLARFFSALPGPDTAKENFFGFITHVHQYGFFKTEDLPLMMVMYEQAEAAYINSVKSWQWSREHTLMLNNTRVLYFSIIKSAIGTEDDVMNQRTALNAMRIQRLFGETTRRKRGLFRGI